MTSIGPYSQSYNMTHMQNIPDLRGCLPKQGYFPGSIMDIIDKHPDFTKFNYMMKLSKLNGIYNDPQANFTVLVPSDRALVHIPEGVFINMDDAVARHIIRASTMNNRITSELLEDSPATYFVTMNRIAKLFVSNINGITYVNNDLRVIHKDMEANNGLLHVIDGLIWPDMI